MPPPQPATGYKIKDGKNVTIFKNPTLSSPQTTTFWRFAVVPLLDLINKGHVLLKSRRSHDQSVVRQSVSRTFWKSRQGHLFNMRPCPPGGTQECFLRGGCALRSNPFPFYLYIIFGRKYTPFVFTFYWQIVPLSHTYNHGQKSWDAFAFLERYSIHTGLTPPLTPQTMLDACIQNSFRVSTLYRVGGGRTARKFRERHTRLRGNRELTEKYKYCSTIQWTFV